MIHSTVESVAIVKLKVHSSSNRERERKKTHEIVQAKIKRVAIHFL